MNEAKDREGLRRTWPNSQLMTAISCLTYGVTCLYFDRAETRLVNCLLSVHEEFINILHVIVEGKCSVLFEMQNIKSISDEDIYVRNTLGKLKMDNFIILYTGSLESHILVMASENEKNVIWEGIQYFIHEATNFYSRISRLDPFKAEITMLFLEADTDGSNLLDIDELTNIFSQLKINYDQMEIHNSILEINNDLYEKENLKKPKGFTKDMMTPLGFEYILRYYSMKASIAPIFSEFCPIFKFKRKKFTKTITDILKSQNKPLMSGLQLKDFMEKYLKVSLPEHECTEIIRGFPVYDGEGKEIPEYVDFLSFNNFSNIVFSITNSLIDERKIEMPHQDMSLPLTEYYVYSSSNTYLSGISINSDSKLEMYERSLKKGCRCLELDIINLGEELVVKHKNSKNHIELGDVLKTIKTVGFAFNPFPIILSVEINFPSRLGAKAKKIFELQLSEYLCVISPEGKQKPTLPSPNDLRNKIILQTSQASSKGDNVFYSIISLLPAKFDFERKGYTSNTTCQIKQKDLVRYEEVEEKNLVDYCRKVMVRTLPSESKTHLENYETMPMLRNGVQLISFNLQKEDEHHYFMHSKFLENGGKNCGYLLKPEWLRSNCFESLYPSSFTRPEGSIKLKVYAGQKFVLAGTEMKEFHLEVYLKGIKIDEQKNNRFVTKPTREGFYCDFELECEFVVHCIDLAHIAFKVLDNQECLVSYRAVSLLNMREGLRTVQLLGPGMELHINSCLLVHYQFVPDERKKKADSIAFA